MKILGVFYGGQSTEHYVSIKCAEEFAKWLSYKEWVIQPFYIAEDGKVYSSQSQDKPFKHNLKDMQLVDNVENALKEVDLVAPIIAGRNGEDGVIQGFLELYGVPYIGNGIETSVLGLNKHLTKVVLSSQGIDTIKHWKIDKDILNFFSDWLLKKNIEYPVFIKPLRLGSSIGVNKAEDEQQLRKFIDEAFKYDFEILIEPALKVREFSVAVLELEDKLFVSNPSEIQNVESYFSYEDKYSDSSKVKRDLSPKLSPELINKIKSISEQVFLLLNGKGLMRVDLFLTEERNIYVNEVNTMPSLIEDGNFTQLLLKEGFKKREIAESLINSAYKHYEESRKIIYSYPSK